MKEQPSQGTPTPNRSTKELVELTLRQELIPMPLLTMELPSPTLLIRRLQLSLATLSKLTNGKKLFASDPVFFVCRLIQCINLESPVILTFAHKQKYFSDETVFLIQLCFRQEGASTRTHPLAFLSLICRLLIFC